MLQSPIAATAAAATVAAGDVISAYQESFPFHVCQEVSESCVFQEKHLGVLVRLPVLAESQQLLKWSNQICSRVGNPTT